MALLSPSYVSPLDNNSCLSIGRSTFVQLQVLSSFALSPVSPPSCCRSGPAGRMSHCYQSISHMLSAAPSCARRPYFYLLICLLLSASLRLYLPASGSFRHCHSACTLRKKCTCHSFWWRSFSCACWNMQITRGHKHHLAFIKCYLC